MSRDKRRVDPTRQKNLLRSKNYYWAKRDSDDTDEIICKLLFNEVGRHWTQAPKVHPKTGTQWGQVLMSGSVCLLRMVKTLWIFLTVHWPTALAGFLPVLPMVRLWQTGQCVCERERERTSKWESRHPFRSTWTHQNSWKLRCNHTVNPSCSAIGKCFPPSGFTG